MAPTGKMPPGVIKSGKKYQARLFYAASLSLQGHNGGPRSLGSFDTMEEAIAAVAAAKVKFAAGGEAAVFDKLLKARATRLEVSSAASKSGCDAACWSVLMSDAVLPRVCHASQAGAPLKTIRKQKHLEKKAKKAEAREPTGETVPLPAAREHVRNPTMQVWLTDAVTGGAGGERDSGPVFDCRHGSVSEAEAEPC